MLKLVQLSQEERVMKAKVKPERIPLPVVKPKLRRASPTAARTHQVTFRISTPLKSRWTDYLDAQNAQQNSALVWLITDAIESNRQLPVGEP